MTAQAYVPTKKQATMQTVKRLKPFFMASVFLPWTAAFLAIPFRNTPTQKRYQLHQQTRSHLLILHQSLNETDNEIPKYVLSGQLQGGSIRRQAIAGVATTLISTIFPDKIAWAAENFSPFEGIQSQLQAESTELGSGLLDSRVTENLLSPPSYGMEGNDILYPSWFKGNWQVSSTTKDVQAPCGIALFGGNSTFDRARSEIGTTLNYESRFIADGASHIIADREYNVRSIAKAAMGAYSVLDIPVATPNKLTCILAPNGSPRLLKVDLIALNRRQETISESKFDCSEVTREIVAPVNTNNGNPSSGGIPSSQPSNTAPILKEVETTSLYTYNPATNEISCLQRSATFLLPSQSSPMAYKMWEASRGRPIDVRFYDVRYKRA